MALSQQHNVVCWLAHETENGKVTNWLSDSENRTVSKMKSCTVTIVIDGYNCYFSILSLWVCWWCRIFLCNCSYVRFHDRWMNVLFYKQVTPIDIRTCILLSMLNQCFWEFNFNEISMELIYLIIGFFRIHFLALNWHFSLRNNWTGFISIPLMCLNCD